MASLSYKIEAYLGRKAKFSAPGNPGEVTLENSGDGDKITYWADSIEKSKPTDSQLNTANTQADTDFTNFKVRKKRRKEYGDIGEQLDEIYKDIDTWKVRIKKIKDDNPKS